MLERPSDLPDFVDPPLNEVSVGVQFVTPARYGLVHAGEVYGLFSDRYPIVQEQPPLPPAFETFGVRPTGIPAVPFRISLGAPALHPRFWFLTEGLGELVQFQSDRLLHNWRQVGGRPGKYPRFESIYEKFDTETLELEGLFQRQSGSFLSVNQIEVTYFNRIYGETSNMLPKPGEWLRFLRFGERTPEAFDGVYREVIRDDSGSPVGRLHCQISTGIDEQNKPLLAVNLTFRGPPSEPTRESALVAILKGREAIVRTFADITTQEAHEKWNRQT